MTARPNDVPAMMARVRATLQSASSRAGGSGVLRVPPEGDEEIDTAALRRWADIDVGVMSGSDRPVAGKAVRLGKRAIRRSLRWYLSPMADQQSRFNHATLDAIEALRRRVQVLTEEVEALKGPPGDAGENR